MRILQALALFIITFSLHAQDQQWYPLHVLPYDNETGKLEASNVEVIKGVDKNTLFNRATKWFAETYVDSRSVLELSDRQAGLLLGDGFMQFDLRDYGSYISTVYRVKHNFKVEIKDHKVKLTLKVISFESESHTFIPSDWFNPKLLFRNNGKVREPYGKYREATLHEMRLTYFGLLKALRTQDDW